MSNRKRGDLEAFPIRRATATEAVRAREFIGQTFTDRIAWVAARILLVRCVGEIKRVASPDAETAALVEAVERFLLAHPDPKLARTLRSRI